MLTGLMSTMSIWRQTGIRSSDEALTETLVRDVEVPEVDAEVVCGDVGLAIRVDRDGVDVVGVCVRVDLARDSGDDVILLEQTWQAETGARCRRGDGPLSVVEVGLCDDLEVLFVDLPQLYRLVCVAVSHAGGGGWSTRAYVPLVERRKCAAFCRRHHFILLIFSSISSDLR